MKSANHQNQKCYEAIFLKKWHLIIKRHNAMKVEENKLGMFAYVIKTSSCGLCLALGDSILCNSICPVSGESADAQRLYLICAGK